MVQIFLRVLIHYVKLPFRKFVLINNPISSEWRWALYNKHATFLKLMGKMLHKLIELFVESQFIGAIGVLRTQPVQLITQWACIPLSMRSYLPQMEPLPGLGGYGASSPLSQPKSALPEIAQLSRYFLCFPSCTWPMVGAATPRNWGKGKWRVMSTNSGVRCNP